MGSIHQYPPYYSLCLFVPCNVFILHFWFWFRSLGLWKQQCASYRGFISPRGQRSGQACWIAFFLIYDLACGFFKVTFSASDRNGISSISDCSGFCMQVFSESKSSQGLHSNLTAEVASRITIRVISSIMLVMLTEQGSCWFSCWHCC